MIPAREKGSKVMLTQAQLRRVLRYDPATGIFRWARGCRKGKAAGTVHDARGFLKVSIAGQRYFLHRLAFLWMTGAMPRSNVEHIDGVRQNNQWQNLREGQRSQKRAYRAPYREPTGYAGIFWVEGRYDASVKASGIILNIGTFPTFDEARGAVRRAHRRPVSAFASSLH